MCCDIGQYELVWPVRGSSAVVFKTGQMVSYDANTPQADDGALQTGVAWPVTRSVDSGDGTVTDNMTKLVWIKNAYLIPDRDPGFDGDDVGDDGNVIRQHALDYVAKLNAKNYLGKNDWRLPNRVELQSLVMSAPGMYAALTSVFDNIGGNNRKHWTSTTTPSDANSTYSFYIYSNGHLSYWGKSSSYLHAWAVRGGT